MHEPYLESSVFTQGTKGNCKGPSQGTNPRGPTLETTIHRHNQSLTSNTYLFFKIKTSVTIKRKLITMMRSSKQSETVPASPPRQSLWPVSRSSRVVPVQLARSRSGVYRIPRGWERVVKIRNQISRCLINRVFLILRNQRIIHE